MRWTAAAGIGLMAWLLSGAGSAADKPLPQPKPAAPAPQRQAVAAQPAASEPAPRLSAHLREVVDSVLKRSVAPRFAVAADDDLDADLRAAAEAMQAEHLPRVRALMERWFHEELGQEPLRSAVNRLQARVANEFALWGRDSTGPAQDAALAQALQRPGMCNPGSRHETSELVRRLRHLRDLPPEVRAPAVQAERELLARWGRPRQVSDVEPLPAEEKLLQLRTTGQAPPNALPPVLAFFYLGDAKDRQRDPVQADAPARCALHQWAGAGPAQFRAAMALQAPDVIGMDRRHAAELDDDAYPRAAGYFLARGLVTVQAEVNASGRLVRAQVVKRRLKVPGIRDARPFALEGTMDLATLAKARETDWFVSAPAQGVRTVERDFLWVPQ
jgi:hypothetical protein